MGIGPAPGEEQFTLAENQPGRHVDDQAFPRPMLL
jgi:hypothetical protein